MCNESNLPFYSSTYWVFKCCLFFEKYVLYLSNDDGKSPIDIIVNIFELDRGTKPGILQREKLDLLDMHSSVIEEEEYENKD